MPEGFATAADQAAIASRAALGGLSVSWEQISSEPI
jgi:hypothetical protein